MDHEASVILPLKYALIFSAGMQYSSQVGLILLSMDICHFSGQYLFPSIWVIATKQIRKSNFLPLLQLDGTLYQGILLSPSQEMSKLYQSDAVSLKSDVQEKSLKMIHLMRLPKETTYWRLELCASVHCGSCYVSVYVYIWSELFH